MAKILYEAKKFTPEKQELVSKIEEICEDYESQGFVLTLRQCYYQCVSKNLIANNEKNYKNLGVLVANARLAGLLDWDMFEDRTRNYEAQSAWDSPSDILYSSAYSYHLHRWKGQDKEPEIWVEKQALENIIERVSEEYDAGYFCCRGYVSLSEMHVAANRIKGRFCEEGRKTVIIYLGDHDPSGVDMNRAIKARLEGFGCTRRSFELIRVALTMDQIRQYNPPPQPAKMTDKRSKKYVEKYGNQSWELDCLSPDVMQQIITDNIKVMIQPEPWRAVELKENRDKNRLRELADNWED